MQLVSYLKLGFIILLTFVCLSIISIWLFDRQLALWIYPHDFGQWHILNNITEHGLVVIGICYLLILGLIPINPKFDNRIFLIIYLIIFVYLTLWVNNKLKIMFGRDWVNTWSGSHQSLLHNNVFQFNFFKYKNWRGSFPSGHMALISVMSMSMYLIYLRYKCLWLIPILIMAISLILQNYHFLGDILSGIALGSFLAYYSLALYLLIKKIIQKMLCS